MTDRRNRTPTRCRVRGCPHLGYFAGSDDLCPSHFADRIDYPRDLVTPDEITDRQADHV